MRFPIELVTQPRLPMPDYPSFPYDKLATNSEIIVITKRVLVICSVQLNPRLANFPTPEPSGNKRGDNAPKTFSASLRPLHRSSTPHALSSHPLVPLASATTSLLSWHSVVDVDTRRGREDGGVGEQTANLKRQ